MTTSGGGGTDEDDKLTYHQDLDGGRWEGEEEGRALVEAKREALGMDKDGVVRSPESKTKTAVCRC
jgi:hypothetical protein